MVDQKSIRLYAARTQSRDTLHKSILVFPTDCTNTYLPCTDFRVTDITDGCKDFDPRSDQPLVFPYGTPPTFREDLIEPGRAVLVALRPDFEGAAGVHFFGIGVLERVQLVSEFEYRKELSKFEHHARQLGLGGFPEMEFPDVFSNFLMQAFWRAGVDPYIH